MNRLYFCWYPVSVGYFSSDVAVETTNSVLSNFGCSDLHDELSFDYEGDFIEGTSDSTPNSNARIFQSKYGTMAVTPYKLNSFLNSKSYSNECILITALQGVSFKKLHRSNQHFSYFSEFFNLFPKLNLKYLSAGQQIFQYIFNEYESSVSIGRFESFLAPVSVYPNNELPSNYQSILSHSSVYEFKKLNNDSVFINLWSDWRTGDEEAYLANSNKLNKQCLWAL